MSWKMDWDMCRYVKTQDGMLEQSEVHDISFCSVTAAVKKRTWLFGTLTEHWALNPHHWTCFASTRIVVTGSVVLCPVTRSPPFRLVSCCDVVSRTIHGANYRTGIQGVKYCERVESEAETTEMFLFHVEFYCFLCSRFLRYISALFDSWNSDRRFGMFDMDIFTFARWRKKVTVQDVHVLMWENVKYMMCLICGKSIVHVIYMWWIIQNHITGDMFFCWCFNMWKVSHEQTRHFDMKCSVETHKVKSCRVILELDVTWGAFHTCLSWYVSYDFIWFHLLSIRFQMNMDMNIKFICDAMQCFVHG